MAVTTILTHIEPATEAELDQSMVAPLALAAALGAHLTALVFPAEINTLSASMANDRIAVLEEAAAARVDDAAARLGLARDVRQRSSFAYGVGEVFADHLRVSDFGVLTIGASVRIGQRFLVGAALFDSGRPLLVVPASAPLTARPREVVVAWDASPAAVRAVHGALPLMAEGAEVSVVTVTDDKGLRDGRSGIELAHLLARHGVRASFVAVPQARLSIHEALAGFAREKGADLLVMGGRRHAPWRDLVFGSATRDLLDRGPRLATLMAG